MQRLISLFAEALEIMNIKAKLNVFLHLSEAEPSCFLKKPFTPICWGNQEIWSVEFVEQVNEIMCHSSWVRALSRVQALKKSVSFIVSPIDSVRCVSKKHRKLKGEWRTKKNMCGMSMPMFIYIEREVEVRKKNKFCWH